MMQSILYHHQYAKIKPIIEAQPLNNAIYQYETGTDQDTISIITSPILVHNTSTPQYTVPITNKSNSPIFQTIENLTVHCLCIDDSNASTTI